MPRTLSQLGPEHWVVLILALLGIGFMVLWFAWLGRTRWRWPEGVRHDLTYKGFDVHVIVPKVLTGGRELAQACAQAVVASARGWADAGNGSDAGDKLSEVAVWFAPAKVFDTDPYLASVNAAAYLGTVQRAVGGGMPCAVIRDDLELFAQVRKTGEPVIHEMLHCLAGQFTDWKGNRDHGDARVWLAAGGAKSAQALARGHFQSLGA